MKQTKHQFDMGYLPPQSLEIEGAILGALMVEPDRLETVIGLIPKNECFYSAANVAVYASIRRIYERGGRIDFMTVCEELKKNSELEMVGGSYYVMNLTRDVISSAHIEAHCRIVMECYMRRELIRVGGELISKAYDTTTDVFETTDEMITAIGEVNNIVVRGKIMTIYGAMMEAYLESEENRAKGVKLIGYSTGYPSVDEKIGGIIKGDYIVIAAGTGEGKSTFALNIAEHLTFVQNVPSLFFSFEMSAKQLGHKIISRNTKTSVKSLRMGQYSDNVAKTATSFVSNGKDVPLYIGNGAGKSLENVLSQIRMYVAKYGVQVVFVDYLQLVRTSGRNISNRENEVSEVSRKFREIGLELDITIIALSQIAELEKGSTRPYKQGDLRESKAIGHDATTLLFLWCPILESQNRNVQSVHYGEIEFTAVESDVLLLVVKNRLDNIGAVRLTKDFRTSQFLEYGGQQQIPTEYNARLIPIEEANKRFGEDEPLPF